MILTCPSCQTRYLVDPVKLGTRGRTVRCAKCGETWTQAPPPDLPKPVDPPPRPQLRPLPRGSNLPALPRRRRANPALVVVLILVILIGLGAAAVLERDRVIARIPALGPLFASVGLAASGPLDGLRIVDAKVEQLRDGDIVVVVVSGAVVNESDRTVAVPTLRGVFRDAARVEIASWTFAPAGERLLPRQSVPFLDRYADPPEGAIDLRVEIEPER